MGLCTKNILASNTLYSVYPKNNEYELLFIFACLNSSFIRNYWKAKYSDNKALFPKIKGFQLKELPIPVVNKEQQIIIVELVEKMISGKDSNSGIDADIEQKIDAMVEQLYRQS